MNNDIYHVHFWCWREDNSVIEIFGGGTIAYREHIHRITAQMAFQGLPRFGSLLLALIAINPNSEKNLKYLETRFLSVLEEHYQNEIKDAFIFLKLLQSLPRELKYGNQKTRVLQAVFEKCHGQLSFKNSKAIVSHLRVEGATFGLIEPGSPVNVEMEKDLRPIALLLRKFKTQEDLLNKIDEIPQLSEDLEWEETEIDDKTEVDFFDQLLSHKSTQNIAQLIPSLWAGLKLPMKASVPTRQPMGGVADLTNKGNYDQLLISEHANDELVFLSRLANNEALYLNRESPPNSDDQERILLIDVSLKNWGIPKIIGFATALSIALHPRSKMDCKVFLIGEKWEAVKYDSLADLIDALGHNSIKLSPVNGLSTFMKENQFSATSEVIFLSCRSVFSSTQILQLPPSIKERINYWVSYDDDGKLDLYKGLKKGKKQIQQMVIPYYKLWSQAEKTEPKIPMSKPANYSKGFYPILISFIGKSRNIVSTNDGTIFKFVKEGAVLRYMGSNSSDESRGWEVIHTGLRLKNDNWTLGATSNGQFVMLIQRFEQKELHLINLTTQELNVKKTVRKEFFARKSIIFFYNDRFFTRLHTGAFEISLDGSIKSIRDMDFNDFSRKAHNIHRGVENKNQLIRPRFPHLKRVKFIGITQDGLLKIGSNVLKFDGDISIGTSECSKLLRTASMVGPYKHEFKDGSLIETFPFGIILLKSSSKDIPPIYIPAFSHTALGLSAGNQFAGNEYFRNEAVYKLHITQINGQNLKLIKVLHEYTRFNLGKLKEMVYGKGEVFIDKWIPQKDISGLKDVLSELGVKHELIGDPNLKRSELEIVPPQEFFKRYIDGFIKVVLSHGS